MKKLLVLFLFHIVPDCYSQTVSCGLDSIFTKDFSVAWSADTFGKTRQRGKYYREIFYPMVGKEQKIPLAGVTKECILYYFGAPNFVKTKKDGAEVYIYLISVSWIGKNKTDYESITLEIFFYQEKVDDYSIMIT